MPCASYRKLLKLKNLSIYQSGIWLYAILACNVLAPEYIYCSFHINFFSPTNATS